MGSQTKPLGAKRRYREIFPNFLKLCYNGQVFGYDLIFFVIKLKELDL